ncbi:MAG: MFS transporter [Phycisphaeraceae bacterium]
MSDPAPRLSAGLHARLSLMMFLQYAIWGAWLPLLWPFLTGSRGFDAQQVSNIFAVGAVGAIVAPFIAGQIADRYIPTQVFLGVSHLLGAALVWQLAWLESYGSFLLFSLVYSLIYAPTLSLTNSLAFHHLPDRDRDFGKVRLWGTVGWIVVGITLGQWLLRVHTPADGSAAEVLAAQQAGMADAFRLSAVLGGLLGVYCLLGLPATPPSRESHTAAPLRAVKATLRQPLLMLFLISVPVSCIHQFYFVHASGFLAQKQVELGGSRIAEAINAVFGVGGAGLMTLGQVAEVIVIGLIAAYGRGVARKWLLMAGLAAYAVRMAVFAYIDLFPEGAQLPVLMATIPLHGVCFGCFIFVAFMVVDEEAPHDVRASAQSLFNLVFVGLGIIVGSLIAGRVAIWATTDGVISYGRLFWVPMWASLVCLALMGVGYPRKKIDP